MAILRFAALYGFWIILSGRFEVKYLIMGAFSAFIVMYLTQDLAQADGPKHVRGDLRDYSVVSGIGNFILYFFCSCGASRSQSAGGSLCSTQSCRFSRGFCGSAPKLRNRTGHYILANSIRHPRHDYD